MIRKKLVFENEEVEQMYYDLHKKYADIHSVGRNINEVITYEYLLAIEEDFKLMLDDEVWK